MCVRACVCVHVICVICVYAHACMCAYACVCMCVYTRAQMNSGFYYLNILYSQLPNIGIFFFSIDMDEISIILLYKMSL